MEGQRVLQAKYPERKSPPLSVLPPPPPEHVRKPPKWRQLKKTEVGRELGTRVEPPPNEKVPVWRRPPPKYVEKSMSKQGSSVGEDIPMWRRKLQRPKEIRPGNQSDHLGIPRPKVERPAALEIAHSTNQFFRSFEAACAARTRQAPHSIGLMTTQPWWATVELKAPAEPSEKLESDSEDEDQKLNTTRPLLAPPWQRTTLRSLPSQDKSVAGRFCRRYQLTAKRTEQIKAKALALPAIVPVVPVEDGLENAPESPTSPTSAISALSESKPDPKRRKGRPAAEEQQRVLA